MSEDNLSADDIRSRNDNLINAAIKKFSKYHKYLLIIYIVLLCLSIISVILTQYYPQYISLEFYNVAQLYGILIIAIQFHLSAFHFPHMETKLKRHIGIDDIEINIWMKKYRKPFFKIIRESLIFSACLGIVGFFQDILM